MKKLICILFTIIIYQTLHAQTDRLLGQYFQNMPAYNPAHAGMSDCLEATTGFRQQWAGFGGSPQVMYLSVYGTLNTLKSFNGGAPEAGQHFKHGMGSYLINNTQGPFTQTEFSLVYAAHVPVMEGAYLALGMSPSLYTAKIDLSEITVKDDINDKIYQDFLLNGASNTHLQLNAGLTFYTSEYYVSYGVMEATSVSLGGNSDMNDEKASLRHHIMAGYRFLLKRNLELIPNAFVRLDPEKPAFFELGARARYNQDFWAGLSYRNDKTLVGMVGMMLQDKWRIGYAYEHKMDDITRYSANSHEISLGIRLFKNDQYPSLW